MAINVPNPGIYQGVLGQHCVDLRNALQELLDDSAYITAMGGASFLTASMGLSSADATVIMNTVGAVTPQNSVVQSLQAWIASTAPIWGGQ